MKPINVDAADFTAVNVNGVEITNQPKHAEVILKEVTLLVKLKSLRQISTKQIKLKDVRSYRRFNEVTLTYFDITCRKEITRKDVDIAAQTEITLKDVYVYQSKLETLQLIFT